MVSLHTYKRLTFALCACAAFHTAACAGGLQVAPVSVEIPERSGVLRLRNDSDTEMRAQVRVYRWHQENGEDELVPTQDLLASPPFVTIAAEDEQVIRLVRFGDNAVDQQDCESTFRVIVDELPDPDAGKSEGLSYVLRYSVPIYLTSPDCDEAQPSLSWTIATSGEDAWLNVVNAGQTRAQIAAISFVDDQGLKTEISPGLLGYVLAGASRKFALSDPSSVFEKGGQLEVMLNGKDIREPVTLAADSQ